MGSTARGGPRRTLFRSPPPGVKHGRAPREGLQASPSALAATSVRHPPGTLGERTPAGELACAILNEVILTKHRREADAIRAEFDPFAGPVIFGGDFNEHGIHAPLIEEFARLPDVVADHKAPLQYWDLDGCEPSFTPEQHRGPSVPAQRPAGRSARLPAQHRRTRMHPVLGPPGAVRALRMRRPGGRPTRRVEGLRTRQSRSRNVRCAIEPSDDIHTDDQLGRIRHQIRAANGRTGAARDATRDCAAWRDEACCD